MFVKHSKNTQPKYPNTELCFAQCLIKELEIEPNYKLTLNESLAQYLLKISKLTT